MEGFISFIKPEKLFVSPMLPLLFSQSASSWTYWMCIGSHFFSSILTCFIWTWNGATYPLPSAWRQGRKRGSKVKPVLCRGPFPPHALVLPWTGPSSVPRRPDMLVKNTDSRAELPAFKSHAQPRPPMWCQTRCVSSLDLSSLIYKTRL